MYIFIFGAGGGAGWGLGAFGLADWVREASSYFPASARLHRRVMMAVSCAVSHVRGQRPVQSPPDRITRPAGTSQAGRRWRLAGR